MESRETKSLHENMPRGVLYLVVGYGSRDDGVMGKSRAEGTRMEEKGCFLDSSVFPL